MPTQAVATINRLFPGVSRRDYPQWTYSFTQANELRGIINLVREVPSELFVLPEDRYAEIIVAVSAIEHQFNTWVARGDTGPLRPVKGVDPVALILDALDQCPDEFPPPATTAELMFIPDTSLRDNIRGDIGAAERAYLNIEWKAATVLAGGAIEALLYWRLDQQPPTSAEINQSVDVLTAKKIFRKKPPSNRNN